MNTKIRTTIIALVAASSFAATSVVPAVSQAQKIDPNRNASAKRAVSKQVTTGCAETREALNEALQKLEQAHKEENAEGRKKVRIVANRVQSSATNWDAALRSSPTASRA